MFLLPAAFKGADASAKAANVASTDVELGAVLPFEAFVVTLAARTREHIKNKMCFHCSKDQYNRYPIMMHSVYIRINP